MHLLKKRGEVFAHVFLRCVKPLYEKVISMNWGRVYISHPPPREILVCLLKLFYVALSWRQIRPHERAIMPPLVAAALRISASLCLLQLGSPGEGGDEIVRVVRGGAQMSEKWLWTGNPSERHLTPLSSPRMLLSCWETTRRTNRTF